MRSSRERERERVDTFTIDNDKKFNPDLCIDVSKLDISMLPESFRNPDIIWASPPCTTFSVASIGTHWKFENGIYEPKTEECREAIKLIEKTLELIKILKPKYWFIENPRGMLRKLPLMQKLHRKEISYCQYGDTRMKPTDVWCNFNEWNPKPMCKPRAECHVAAPRGSRTGTQGLKNNVERGRIPKELFEEILEQWTLKR